MVKYPYTKNVKGRDYIIQGEDKDGILFRDKTPQDYLLEALEKEEKIMSPKDEPNFYEPNELDFQVTERDEEGNSNKVPIDKEKNNQEPF